MAIVAPFNLNWIDENRHLLKPPVGNKTYSESGDYIVMIVAGPNARKDFHYNETEELFYQLEGSIKVIVQEDGQRKEIELHPVTYLHQAKMPHSPFRRFDRAGNRAKRAGKSLRTAYSGIAIIATINYMRYILN
jgi:3-hydroxyanthranilate 3,4-dioxygenase